LAALSLEIKTHQIDVVLLGEFSASSPDLVLRLAVLDRAIRDILDVKRSKRCANAAAKRQALNWLNSETRNASWLTFIEVCEDLNLEYTLIRKKILEGVDNQAFSDRFNKMQGYATFDPHKRVRLRAVRYSKTHTPASALDELLQSKASAEETTDRLPSESKLCAG
jgi:hypothetical protein